MTDAAEIRQFARTHLCAGEDGANAVLTSAMWAAICAGGISGVGVPGAFGGSGHNLPDQAAAARALVSGGAAMAVSLGWLHHAVCASIIDEFADDRLMERLRAGFAGAAPLICFAGDTPASEPDLHLGGRELIEPGGAVCLMEGRKRAGPGAVAAGYFLVALVETDRDDEQCESLFLVARDTPGLNQLPSSAHAEFPGSAVLEFSGCRVPAHWRIGPSGRSGGQPASALRQQCDIAGLGLRLGNLDAMIASLREQIETDGADSDPGRVAFLERLDGARGQVLGLAQELLTAAHEGVQSDAVAAKARALIGEWGSGPLDAQGHPQSGRDAYREDTDALATIRPDRSDR